MKRVTLRFRSDSGVEYLYDDVTGNVFPWSNVEDAILNRELNIPLTEGEQQLLDSAPPGEIDAKTRFLRQWRSQYQAFARVVGGSFAAPTEPEVKETVWANSQVLILCLTEDCNLNCSYCCYASGAYPYNRKPSNRSMSFARAAKAIDWFVASKSSALARDPRRQLGLSFYGGEPLVSIKVIEQVMEHVEQQYPGRFVSVLTTNGVLLTEKNVSVLAKYNVKVGVSIDGPEEEHDRLRVDHEGKGSYQRVLCNLKRIKQTHPEYWRTMVSISTYDPESDLEKIARFFEDNREFIPRCIFVNQVAHHNSEYYNRFSEETLRKSAKQLAYLREKYKQTLIKGEEPNCYCHGITGAAMTLTLARPRVADVKPFIPHTACCIPGARMAVNVDGRIDMCERVSGMNPIGHIDRGLDYGQIGRLIQNFQQHVLPHCAACPASHLCNLCFSFAETQAGIAQPSRWCENTVAIARRNLSDYVSVLEADGAIKSMFERSSLEDRPSAFLFQS